ncbi:RNA-directed DNA polymerase, eukaryota [Tanacetum coccineum]
MGARSFASILSGKNGSQKAVLAGTITKSITLENSDLLELSDTSNIVLAKVRDVHLIINIHSVLKKEGFSDFKCKYMGGLWLWIEFSNDESRLKFQKNTKMEWFFTQRKPVSHNFIPDDRMIWIEIEGLPLKAWTVNAFKRIAGNWGEAVFVDDDAEENIATGRVPNFDSSDNISQHDHESEASDNDQNLHSTNELEDEEGEINDKEDSLGHQLNVHELARTGSQDKENSLKENIPETSSKESWAEASNKVEQHPTQGVDVENQKIQSQGKSSRVGLSNASSHSARPSHTKRSDSKMCQSTGSMIDNFLHHINMGNALGYDMFGSQSDLKKFIDSIRAKHEEWKKQALWNSILLFMQQNPGMFIVFGDFNVVRNEVERIGSRFNLASATDFNNFILEGRFWDVPLGGHSFTRITSNGEKLSKLDRFLKSEDIPNVIHSIQATVLDCHISDYWPIVLKQSKVDFGPIPFKLFNSWMLHSQFDVLVNSIVNSRKQEQEELRQEINRIELNIEAGHAGSKEKSLRQSKIRRLGEIDKQEGMYISQKAKIKWGIEGDDNTKYFHGVLNRKRRSLAINGIMKDGIWLTEPSQIKDTFFYFFEEKFKKFEGIIVNRKSVHYNTLSVDHNLILQSVISEQEIRDAIWACGSDKSPGPDGFSFAFYKKYWDTLKPGVLALIGVQYKIIAKILANRLYRVIDSLISPEQTTFIRGRQILDGPLLVNELIDWYKRKKITLMVFKIDFEKAFDSVSWDFIFQILQFMGFGQLWISWIRGCLISSRASVLVNGSPSREFNLHRGLRQGDPLSPFLFILVMEGLTVPIKDVIDAGLFHGARIGTLQISYLLFKDDVLILGCKSQSMPFVYLGLPVGMNMFRLKGWDPILDKFKNRLSKWKASMLSIDGRTTLVSSVLGALGIYYLSLFPMPVNIEKNLEAMRAKFFWGSTVDDKKIQWIKWKSVLTSKKYGGLGIGSLQALNLSLIQKWRWRYVHNHHALWVKVVSSIHGHSNDGICFSKLHKNSMWARIINSVKAMHEKGIILHSNMRRKLNNGVSIKFWHDIWIGDCSLKTRFPRLFRLDTDPHCLVRDQWINGSWVWSWSRLITRGSLYSQIQALYDLLHNSRVCDTPDVWEWTIGGSNSFSVKETRIHIDNIILPDVHIPTRWIRYIPKKVNVMIWRALRDRLPTRWNISRKGIELFSLLCPICNQCPEHIDHILWNCPLAVEIWHKVFLWLDISFPVINSFAASFEWLEDLQITR